MCECDVISAECGTHSTNKYMRLVAFYMNYFNLDKIRSFRVYGVTIIFLKWIRCQTSKLK